MTKRTAESHPETSSAQKAWVVRVIGSDSASHDASINYERQATMPQPPSANINILVDEAITAKKPLGFLDLPREMRDMVYDYMVPRGRWRLHRSVLGERGYRHKDVMPRTCCYLQQTCQTIRHEVLDMWLKRNSLTLNVRYNAQQERRRSSFNRPGFGFGCENPRISADQFLNYSDFTMTIHYVPGRKGLIIMENYCWYLAALLARKRRIRKLTVMVRTPSGPIADESPSWSYCHDSKLLLQPFKELLGNLESAKITCVIGYDGHDGLYMAGSERVDLHLPPYVTMGKGNPWSDMCRELEKRIMGSGPRKAL